MQYITTIHIDEKIISGETISQKENLKVKTNSKFTDDDLCEAILQLVEMRKYTKVKFYALVKKDVPLDEDCEDCSEYNLNDYDYEIQINVEASHTQKLSKLIDWNNCSIFPIYEIDRSNCKIEFELNDIREIAYGENKGKIIYEDINK